MSCHEIALGANAREYIESLLEDGLSLSTLVAASLDNNSGRIFTVLPEHVDYSAVVALSSNAYKNGGIVVHGGGRACGIEFVDGIVHGSDKAVCVFENALAKPGDPWLERARSRYLVHGNEVYHFASSQDHYRAIAAFQDSVSGWMQIGYILTTPTPSEWRNKQQLSESDLRLLASQVNYVIASAFDSEGFIFWRLEQLH